MIKKSFAGLTTLVLALSVLSACGGGGQSAAPDSASSVPAPEASVSTASSEAQAAPAGEGEATTLRIVWWGSQSRHDKTLQSIDLYMQNNPHITIEPEYLTWSNYWDKLASQAAASTMPDIIQNDYNYIETYKKNSLIISLEPFVGNELNLADCDDVYLSGGRVDGELYGINIGSGGPTIVYDPAVFEKLGIDEPSPDWTYDDYDRVMREIREKENIFGATMLYDGSMYRGLEAYCRQRGQSIYNADGTALNFDKQTFTDYLTMYSGWQADKLVATPDVLVDAKVNVESDLICTGKSAMVWRNSNQIVAMTTAANRPLKMTNIPKDPNQVQYGGYIKPNMLWSISKDSKNASESAKFIDFFTNDIACNKILMAERGVPISSKVREALLPEMGDAEKTMFAYIDQYVNYASPMDPPQPASFAELNTLLDNIEQRIVFGELTVEAATEEFFQSAETAIKATA